MGGPAIRDPTPAWLKPENASVFDSYWTRIARLLGGVLGAGDPASQVMGIAAPLEIPGDRTLGDLGRGLYSRVDAAVAKLPAKGAHPNKVASILKANAPAEELAYRQVPAFLAQHGNTPVTPAALDAHLAQHPAPVPVVKTRGKGRVKTFEEWTADQGLSPEAVEEYRSSITRSYNAFRESEGAREGGTKYAQYQVPGGEKYRETLLTLPEKPPQALPEGYSIQPVIGNPNAKFALQGPDGSGWVLHAMTEEQAHANAINRLQREGVLPKPANFHSSHFDEPNILVHTRSNERTLPTGERGRFIEEVQSDWHQKGKREGYARDTSAELAKLASEWESLQRTALWGEGTEAAAATARMGEITDEMNALHDLAGGVPDAPFKETWPDLGLKQQILETAADPHAQWIGHTSGQTQAARYDLSKQISEVHYSGSNLKAYDHDGNVVLNQTGIAPGQLPDYIGKEAADKLLAQEPHGTLRSLSGVDLQVGGEGMKHFYDQLLPKRLEKILKPFGGTVERGAVAGGIEAQHHGTRALGEAFFDAAPHAALINGKLPVGPSRQLFSREELAEAFVSGRVNALNMPRYLQDAVERMGGVKEPAWIARLTPEMKARILKEGLPLAVILGLTPLSQVGQPRTEQR